jgi:hypothetical protein
LSDNRDHDINQFEILKRTEYELNVKETIFQSHVHSILSKFVLFCDAVKPPKKGKVVKLDDNDVLVQRGMSLMSPINQYEKMMLTVMDEGKVINHLSKLLLTVMRSCVVVVAGQHVLVLDKDTKLSTHPNDSLSEREECCAPYLIEASILCRESINIWESYKKDL